MKKNFTRLTFLASLMAMSQSVYAYKYVIFTDEEDPKKSREVAELMKTTYPFNTFDIEIEIVKVSAKDLECQSTLGIERLVTCNNLDEIQKKATKLGGDQAMIVKDLGKWGGSASIGSGVPTITTGTSPRAMLHEYMHTLGLCDEYEYKAEEANLYCNVGLARPNLVYIDPRPSYGNDSQARSLHFPQIPWDGQILATTLITNGDQLGTGAVNFKKQAAQNTSSIPMALEEPTGLYRGQICNKAIPAKVSWHPGGSSTIMNNVDAGLGGPMEKIVEKILVSKGLRKKMQYDNNTPVQELKGGEVVVSAEPAVEINNSGRSLFKSFFEWVRELFESIGRSLTR